METDIGVTMIDWDDQPLGVIKDQKLANQLGVSRQRVAKARKTRGIPPAGNKINGMSWDEIPLGEVPDAVLARKLGVSPGTVHYQRTRRERLERERLQQESES